MAKTFTRNGILYIERAKNFYVRDGLETEPEYIEAIQARESRGDKLN